MSEIKEKSSKDNWLSALGIGLGIGALYGLYCLLSDKKPEINVNINNSTYHRRRGRTYVYTTEKSFYKRRREAYQRMHREKIFVTFDDIDDFHTRWKKKWVEEEFHSPSSYDRDYLLGDIY